MVPTYFRRCSGIERFNGHSGFALFISLHVILLCPGLVSGLKVLFVHGRGTMVMD